MKKISRMPVWLSSPSYPSLREARTFKRLRTQSSETFKDCCVEETKEICRFIWCNIHSLTHLVFRERTLLALGFYIGVKDGHAEEKVKYRRLSTRYVYHKHCFKTFKKCPAFFPLRSCRTAYINSCSLLRELFELPKGYCVFHS